MRVVQIRRWEVGAAFFALLLVVVYGFARIQQQNDRIHKLAVLDHKLALSNQRAIHEIDRFRIERASATTRTDLKLCLSQKKTRAGLRRILLLGQRLSRANPNLTTEQRATSERFYAQALSIEHPLDCSSLPTSKIGANGK